MRLLPEAKTGAQSLPRREEAPSTGLACAYPKRRICRSSLLADSIGMELRRSAPLPVRG
jgi:hypothetical protein